jgi:hypothetical protein
VYMVRAIAAMDFAVRGASALSTEDVTSGLCLVAIVGTICRTRQVCTQFRLFATELQRCSAFQPVRPLLQNRHSLDSRRYDYQQRGYNSQTGAVG